ncbi:MAG: hypothetical protein AAGF97_15085, partial [Planctomycetota bacterium]
EDCASGDYSIVDEGSSTTPPSSSGSRSYQVVPTEPQPTPALRNSTEQPPGPDDSFDEQLDADDEFEIEMPTESTSYPRVQPTPSPEVMMDASGEFEIIEPTMEGPTMGADPDRLEMEATPPLPLPGSPAEVEPVPTAAPMSNDLSIRLQSFAEADTPEMVDAHVTHVVAQGRLANARDFDNKQTDADLLVIVEPRNANGGYVALAGPVSIVVLDGAAEGSAARVARWDFDAAAVRRRFRSSPEGRGAHFSLEWPEQTPQSDQLTLFVRYENVEGRKLEADVPLAKTRDNGDSSEGWRVVKSKHKLATWQKESKSVPLAPRDKAIQLEPVPTANSQPASAKAKPVEMPRRVRSSSNRTEGVPEWSPDR